MKLQKMNPRLGRKLAAFLAIAATMAVAAFADTAYLTRNDSSTNSSFTNETAWTIAGAPSPSYDYVAAGFTVSPPRWYDSSSPTTFNGRSLTIGEVGGSSATLACYPFAAGASVTFANEGLVLANGEFCNWYGNPIAVFGKIAVTAPQSAPIGVYANGNNQYITFRGAISGAAGTGLWLYSRVGVGMDSWSQTHFICHFTDNCLAGYNGTITCHQFRRDHASDAPHSSWRTEFAFDTGTFPGTLVINNNCAVRGETAASVISVGTLEMRTNACIQVVYDKTSKTASQVRVTGSFVHDEGKVRVLFTSPHSLGSYADADLVPPLAIFKAPAGITLDAADFALETATFPTFTLYVETDADDGLSTLYLKQHGKVATLLQDDAADDAAYCFSFGDHWSDGNAPNPQTDYFARNKTMRLYAANGSTFAGHTLALQTDSGSSSYFNLHRSKVTVPDLRILGAGNAFVNNASGETATLAGRIRLDGTGVFRIYGNNGLTTRIESEIEGSETLLLQHSANKKGQVTLIGLNTNFTGVLRINSAHPVNTSDSVNLKLVCADGKALGGPMKTWTYNGHHFANYAILEPSASITLNRENCGFFVDGNASIVAYEKHTHTFLERITWNGRLRISGGGRFALGGEAPFFTTDGGTIPVDGKNRLYVQNGIIVPLSSEAFQGVNVDFAAGKGVEIRVPELSDSGLGRYGMHNTLIDNPFTFVDEKLNVSIVDPAGASTPSVQTNRSTIKVPICTVNATAAAGLRDKIAITSEPYSVNAVRIKEIINGDGSTTFVAVLGIKGFIISFY